MTNYYNRVYGHLAAGEIAMAEDINLMQTNIADAIKAYINDHHEHTAFILGSKQDSFILTPAPKRLGKYIDTMNLVESGNEEWLSIRKWGYRQKIKKSKSSLYSIICKFRNLSNNSITVWCELRNCDNEQLKKRTAIEIPANTESAEFEIVFDQEHLNTAPGLSHNDVEPFDSKYIAPPPKEESFEQGIDHTNEQNHNNTTIGASEFYFIVEALNINETDIAINGDEDEVITDETFAILADKSGSYGKLLEQYGGLDYSKTTYDLHFKDVYATTSTYLCEMGEAVIDGQKVKCMDTHISIAGASDFGNVNTFVYMDIDGHLRAINSAAFLQDNIETTRMPGAMLPIAIITTYMNDVKQPVVYQDDTSLLVRPRSHHERLRRVEKQVSYLDDIAMPARLKYALSGKDIINDNPAGEVGKIDKGNYYLTTNAKGDVIIKNSEAESITIPITLKEKTTDATEEKDKSTTVPGDIAIAQTLAEIKEMEHDKEKGTLKLKKNQEKTQGSVGLTDEAAKETAFNPWDDDASNRPTNSDIKPTEREYSVTKGKNSADDWESEFPAMTFYTEKDYNLTGITIPITKFKNCESIKFIIWKRQGPNNKTNDVWFEKKIYTSESFSLDNAKIKDDYQIMENGFTIKIDKGLNLPQGQYVIVCIHSPKEGTGSCFVETYKPNDPKDFCIRYYGAADASHFLLKERYHEIWYNSALFTGTEAKLAKEGSVVSGTVTWENEEPITTIVADANITTPEKCSYQLYADTGGGYQKLELGKPTYMTGGGVSFKWKLEFKGDEDTPVLEFNEEKGYAIQFVLGRKKPDVGMYNDKNECLTTNTFRGEDILKEYIGDPNFNASNTRFSNYEFVRIWGQDNIDEEMKDDGNYLIIDIAASDEEANVSYSVTENGTATKKTVKTDIFSLIYADLTLNDFSKQSVDYNNYDNQIEHDEHNLRLKLDTAHSYNDNNIDFINYTDSEYLPTDGVNNYYPVAGTEIAGGLSFSKSSAPAESKILQKISVPNGFVDLTKYNGIRIGFSVKGSPSDENDYTAIKGLGLYISSTNEEDTPSLKNDENNDVILTGVENLPDLNQQKDEIINQYYGKILRVENTINDVQYITYFKYVKDRNGNYTIQQVNDLKSYALYKLPDIKFDKDSENTIQYVEIDIDPNNINLSHVKELGFVAMVNEGEFNVVNDCDLITLSLKAMEKDYYPIYDPSTGATFEPFRADLSGTSNHYVTALQTQKTAADVTPQKRCRIDIYYDRIAGDGEILAYFPIEKSCSNFKHMGLQLAANCWIPKNALELHFCSDSKGKQSLYSLRIPTLNTIHDPIASTVTQNKDDGFVKFSQIFKKINEDITIKSISIRATDRFKKYMQEIRAGDVDTTTTTDTTTIDDYISLYIGKIVLYRAETIPIFHKNMRLKIYNNNIGNGLSSELRKIGCVLEYK